MRLLRPDWIKQKVGVSSNDSHTYIVLDEFGPLCKLECAESLTSTAANRGRGLIPNHERPATHIF